MEKMEIRRSSRRYLIIFQGSKEGRVNTIAGVERTSRPLFEVSRLGRRRVIDVAPELGAFPWRLIMIYGRLVIRTYSTVVPLSINCSPIRRKIPTRRLFITNTLHA